MTPWTILVALVLAMLGPVARPAAGDVQIVLGKLFVIVDPDPGDVGKRRVKIFGREDSGSSTLVGDPTFAGAWLYVEANNPVPPPEPEQFFFLPAAGWTHRATGFVYRDPAGAYGAVRLASIKDNGRFFSLKAVLGPHSPSTLGVVPPRPGSNGAATLVINAGDTYCMRFGGAAGGIVQNTPPPVGSRRFKVTDPTAEAGCAHCSPQGGGVCGGSCPVGQACGSIVGGTCECFPAGTGSTTTSTTSTSSTTMASASPAFVDL